MTGSYDKCFKVLKALEKLILSLEFWGQLSHSFHPTCFMSN